MLLQLQAPSRHPAAQWSGQCDSQACWRQPSLCSLTTVQAAGLHCVNMCWGAPSPQHSGSMEQTTGLPARLLRLSDCNALWVVVRACELCLPMSQQSACSLVSQPVQGVPDLVLRGLQRCQASCHNTSVCTAAVKASEGVPVSFTAAVVFKYNMRAWVQGMSWCCYDAPDTT